MNLKMNRKAVTSLQAVLLIIVIIGVIAAVAFSLGSAPTSVNSDITVYIDTAKQSGNISEPQTLTWSNVQAGNTYTKNFTVTNTGSAVYNLLLLTTEPAGTTQTWPCNNTQISPSTYSEGTLTLTLSATPQAGSYTWMLLATNSTTTITPTPNPSATPIPNSLGFTIQASTGVQNITITRNSQPSFTLLPTDLPKTYTFTPGDNLKFLCGIDQYFTWNGWEFNDGSMPHMNNPIILVNASGNFTIKATTIMTQP